MILLRYLVPGNLPIAAQTNDVAHVQREIILQRVFNTLLALVTVGLPLVLIFYPAVIRSGLTGIYLTVYTGLATLTFLRFVDYHIRAGILIVVLNGFGAMALLSYGLSGTGVVFLFAAAVLSILLLPQKTGRPLAFLPLVTIATVGYLLVSGMITLPPIETLASSAHPGQWMVAAMVFLFLISLVVGSAYSIFDGMSASLKAQQSLTVQLEQAHALLERRVEESSTDLKQRISQFEIASEIAREISGEANLERLLNTAANLIRDRFGFYHVGIFIADSRGEYAVLRAATGEAGRAMLERDHRLKIGEVGIVGYVIKRGEARIASDVSNDLTHYHNPLLPQTRSEIALPLRRAGNTIGALNVQSTQAQAFSLEDIRILQIIADQMAIAFEKTLLVEELQRSLQELDSSYQAITLKSWRTHLKTTRQKTGFRYRNSRLEAASGDSQQALEALETGQPVLRVNPSGEQRKNGTVLAVPIKLRNQVLGVVDIWFERANVSPDLIALIQSTVDRLAISLENARLLEDIQQRAERDRLVSEVSTKIRSASDVDSVLQIAIQEIGKSLGVSEVIVQLRKDS